MKCRRYPVLITLLVVGIISAPLTAEAQQARKVYRVGLILTTSPVSVMMGPDPVHPHAKAFVQGLRERGYVEGQNIVIERRSGEGKVERYRDLVAELVRLRVDVIVVATNAVALAAKQTTSTIPIVCMCGNTVESGLVASLARPGANITGVSPQGLDLIGKRLQLLQEAVPRLSRVAYLTDPTEPYSSAYLREVQVEAKALGVRQVLSLEVRAAAEFERAFAELARERPDALLVEPNSVTLTHRKRIADVTLAQRLPTMYAERRFMDAHGLMSYGVSLPEHFRRAAVYVDKILKGAKPADLPVEQPTKFELIINLKTARTLGLTIPQSLLLRADQVTE